MSVTFPLPHSFSPFSLPPPSYLTQFPLLPLPLSPSLPAAAAEACGEEKEEKFCLSPFSLLPCDRATCKGEEVSFSSSSLFFLFVLCLLCLPRRKDRKAKKGKVIEEERRRRQEAAPPPPPSTLHCCRVLRRRRQRPHSESRLEVEGGEEGKRPRERRREWGTMWTGLRQEGKRTASRRCRKGRGESPTLSTNYKKSAVFSLLDLLCLSLNAKEKNRLVL